MNDSSRSLSRFGYGSMMVAACLISMVWLDMQPSYALAAAFAACALVAGLASLFVGDDRA
jgi:hypothetical protein